MPRTRHGVSLVNLLMRMRSLGHGSHYTRKTWLKYPGTHWRVLETKRKDRTPHVSKIKGLFRFKGHEIEDKSKKVRGFRKKEWVMVYNGETGQYCWPRALNALPPSVQQEWDRVYFKGRASPEYQIEGAGLDWEARSKEAVQLASSDDVPAADEGRQ